MKSESAGGLSANRRSRVLRGRIRNGPNQKLPESEIARIRN
jgi:hypothetical protein